MSSLAIKDLQNPVNLEAHCLIFRKVLDVAVRGTEIIFPLFQPATAEMAESNCRWYALIVLVPALGALQLLVDANVSPVETRRKPSGNPAEAKWTPNRSPTKAQ